MKIFIKHNNTFKAGFIDFHMIVVDLEMSGLNIEKCGIWQIGAVDLKNPENIFFEESRIDDEDIVEAGALKVIGKTEKELRDKSKQSPKQLLQNFFKWCEETQAKTLIAQHPQADFAFLENKAWKYELDFPLNHRAFDLHSITQIKYFELNGEFLMNQDKSEMGLGNTLKLVGMSDPRKAHNALEDAKLTAECFFRLVYGKSLLAEYFQFKVPKYLKQVEDEVL